MTTNQNDQRRATLSIKGKVQGVGFRYSARMIAEHIGIRGLIRNLPDGSVEAVAEGDAAAVENFIRWCHLGPQYCQVSEVIVREETPTGEFDSFQTEHN